MWFDILSREMRKTIENTYKCISLIKCCYILYYNLYNGYIKYDLEYNKEFAKKKCNLK